MSTLTTKTVRVEALARVEGEGALYLRSQRRRGGGSKLADLRAATLLRSLSAWALLRRSTRHHRAHLWHLPRRLPDERRPCHGEMRSA